MVPDAHTRAVQQLCRATRRPREYAPPPLTESDLLAALRHMVDIGRACLDELPGLAAAPAVILRKCRNRGWVWGSRVTIAGHRALQEADHA
ncbi:hypothetical protein [Azospirillum thermophilum]|uniref:hypothetical protein n=1 Tax=Azospirillum thermophilum TaxID=2202148 RepID=UPI0011B65BB6|nr:hypothetical protein [Azospirillum thermophilum]